MKKKTNQQFAVPRKDSNFFHLHAHSQFSPLDGTANVGLMVDEAVAMKHPGLAITDHGNMAASVKLYKDCKANRIKPYPGFEGYMIDPLRDDWEQPEKKSPPVGRYHYCMVALTERGYMGLVKFNSMTHTRPRFNRFPRNTLSDLIEFGKEYGEDVVLTTGCYFGLIQQNIARGRSDIAERYVVMLAKVFPHLFVEVKNHNICHDEQEEDEELLELDDNDIVDVLFQIASSNTLPVVATQDSHYLKQRQKGAHTLMKRMVYSSAEDGFPGDSFHLASADWVAEHYPQWQWDKIESGFDELVDLHDLSISPLDNYKPRVPVVSKTPNKEIRTKCRAQLRKLGKLTDNEYRDRMTHELGVIKTLGMANYFVIVADGIRYCQEHDIMVESRGSANGSLVCYLLGITQVDPIKWGGLFERFLSEDRTKPPDIDIDIEDVGRGRLLEYWLHKYGAVQIGTWGLLGTTIDPETGEEKGSVLQTWLTSKRRESEQKAKAWAERQERVRGKKPLATEIKEYGHRIFAKNYASIQNLEDVAEVSMDDYKHLRELSNMGSVYKSYGVHAGGVLLSGPGVKIEDYIPTMLVASSDTRVTQYAMDDVEAFGLLKMDVLGQSSLRMMKRCQELIGVQNPTDFSWIPEDDPDACRLLRDGRTKTGIFHFEGYALRNDSPVLTPTGWKPIGDLEVGDAVVDPAGKPSKVTAVYPQDGPQQLFRVEFGDGSWVDATSEHLWTVRLRHSAFKGKPDRTVDTDTLRKYLTSGYRVQMAPMTPPDLESPGETHSDPYLVGLLLGDGSLSQKGGLRFTSADQELIDNFSNRKVGDYDYWLYEPDLLKEIRRTGLKGTRSHEKFVPNEYLWTTAANRLAILQGLMDTDGSIDTDGRMEFCTTSDQLAQDVEFLIRSLGGKCSRYLKPWNGQPITMPQGHTVTAMKDSWQIRNIRFADQSIVPFRLERKVARCKTDRGLKGFTVTRIRPVGKDDATCITVSASSSLYITKDWIVTHNTKAKGGREMKVRSTEDAVMVQALYMPGAMNSGQTAEYIKRRFSAHERSKITYISPEFERALQRTYGTVIFQEQIIDVMRDFGLDIETINVFFKVVKDSGRGAVERNQERMKSVRSKFDAAVKAKGVDPDAAWEMLAGFASYGFNRAHASGYGIRSYRTAYLKAYHPGEFMAALLETWAGRDKESDYVREARRIGLRLLPPDVNVSGSTWTLDPNDNRVIRRGLVSISGVGVKAAEQIAAEAPFKSVEDMIERVPGRAMTGGKKWLETGEWSGILEKLKGADALESLGE